MKIKNLKKAGFTLIELLVVISIIALLSSVVLVAVQSAREKALMSKVRSELSEFVKALEIYKTSHGYYPSSAGCSWSGRLDLCSTATGAMGDFSTVILTKLKADNIYSGDLITILKSIPKEYDYSLLYASTPTGVFWLLGGLGGSATCGSKPITASSEYYMQIQVRDLSYDNMPGLDSTYIGKEKVTSLTGLYCSPNN